MNRLIEKGLMFGGLIAVDSPELIARYNRALKQLTGKETKLTDFHIDLSGFSPEVGDELGDMLYLNPNGCNRMFILLSTEQHDAPLLNAQFSHSKGILEEFIEENEAQLFSLTAQDVVCGELEDTVMDVSEPARLFDIRRVTVQADTTGKHAEEAGKLTGLIERFKTEPEAWADDLLIAEMIGLAKKTGDVTRNPVRLTSTPTDVPDFWTAHFGGLYIFRSVAHPAAICAARPAGAMPIERVYDLAQRNEIAKFFEINGLVEPIVLAQGPESAAILRQKMDFILVEAATRLGIDTGAGTRRELRQVAARLGPKLPEEFQALAALLRWVETGGPWPRITSAHPAYFYTLRAAPGRLKSLVNMLLAELSPLDVRQLYICHKELFFRHYASWPDAKKTYVADFLAREYQVDKDGARAALYGPDEPPMEEPKAPQRPTLEQIGPWGAVRR